MTNHHKLWLWVCFFAISIFVLAGIYFSLHAFGWAPSPEPAFMHPPIGNAGQHVQLWEPDEFLGLPVYHDTNGIASLSLPDALFFSLLRPFAGFVEIYPIYLLINFLLFTAGIFVLGRCFNLHPLAVLTGALLVSVVAGFFLFLEGG